MNTMRVFLHNLLWEQDPEGFYIASTPSSRHLSRSVKISVPSLFSLTPVGTLTRALARSIRQFPGVHNSGWVRAPGAELLSDPAQFPSLESYVKGIVGSFANDPRILAWDLWNEPDNTNQGSVFPAKNSKNKTEIVIGLLPQALRLGPVTSSCSAPHQRPLARRLDLARDPCPHLPRIQIEQSDIISFNNYGWPEDSRSSTSSCSINFTGRSSLHGIHGSRRRRRTFDTVLPIAHQYHVAAINWGLVAGKSQTACPRDSWAHPYVLDFSPWIWFHDVFHAERHALSPARRVDIIRSLTAR